MRSAPQTVGIVAIGVSTGGPAALSKLIPELSKDFSGSDRHRSAHAAGFYPHVGGAAPARGNGVKVVEGVDGMILEPGTAYIAPGNYHMAVRQKEGRSFLAMNQEPPVNYCRPSVDVLFRSVAEVYREETLGIIMTGMGQDGLNGIRAMKSKGAIIFAQDQASSVVWGMPSFVVREGLADCVLPLDEMKGAIEDCVMKRIKR
ncbi:MAG: CheB methylesterase domain-containing protein [Candidatus Manganitrophus sp.]|nr:CheB methylesterase domain-containing protein [Candidatus Manganitrophus sp.]